MAAEKTFFHIWSTVNDPPSPHTPTVSFEEAEWKVLHCYVQHNPVPPENPLTLREGVHMTASLGGFLGRKGDGEPGIKSLWLGIQRLDGLTSMWKIMADNFALYLLIPPCSVTTQVMGNDWPRLEEIFHHEEPDHHGYTS